VTAGRGRDPFAVDEGDALAALALAWGHHYKISITGGQWQARRNDAPEHDILTGTTPDELNRAIRADWQQRTPGDLNADQTREGTL
jgi:hypothetical protein